ncbi:MAG: hypothetical protein WBJ44_07070 [Propionicimonas sp.]
MSNEEWVWVFNGARATFPVAVFHTKEQAAEEVRRRGLTGTITAYPLDWFSIEWAAAKGFYKEPISGKGITSEMIERYVSERQEHFHYENGEPMEE